MQLIAVLFQIQSLQQFGGVSGIVDWTMVPYVKKSFYKHFKEGLDITEEECTEDIGDYLSIVDTAYKSCPKAYKYAICMTDREVYQSAEGLFHNLNTLQSRSGWAYAIAA